MHGMGIEIPQWVVASKNNKKVYNRKKKNLVNEPCENCLFDTEEQAEEILKDLDFGLMAKMVRVYHDATQTNIRMN